MVPPPPPVVDPFVFPKALPASVEESAALELVQALKTLSEAISNSGAKFRDFLKIIDPRSRAIESLLHGLNDGINALKTFNFLLCDSELMAIFLTPRIMLRGVSSSN